MKRYWLISMVILLFLTACNANAGENTPVVESRPAGTAEAAASLPDAMVFSDEESLIQAITEAKQKDPDTYAQEKDYWKLSELNSFYKPKHVLEELAFIDISVCGTYVAYSYSYGEYSLNFSWFRPFDPNVFMKELKSHRNTEESEINGITYLITSYYADGEEKPGAYGISWVQNNKCFQVFSHSVFDLDTIMTMCEAERVKVE